MMEKHSVGREIDKKKAVYTLSWTRIDGECAKEIINDMVRKGFIEINAQNHIILKDARKIEEKEGSKVL